jgi:hypothetical protein
VLPTRVRVSVLGPSQQGESRAESEEQRICLSGLLTEPVASWC